MNVEAFANSIRQNYLAITAAYVAIIPLDSGDYGLEVEIADESRCAQIAGVYDSHTPDVEAARTTADELADALGKVGIQVYNSREDWENMLDTPLDEADGQAGSEWDYSTGDECETQDP
jgi:methionine synthase II (cobalamin-independent)